MQRRMEMWNPVTVEDDEGGGVSNLKAFSEATLPIVNHGYPSSIIFRSSLGLILPARRRRINHAEILSRAMLKTLPFLRYHNRSCTCKRQRHQSPLCICYLNNCISVRAVALLNIDALCPCVSSYVWFEDDPLTICFVHSESAEIVYAPSVW